MSEIHSSTNDITSTLAWANLGHHARELQAAGISLKGLFEADPERAARFTTTVGDLIIDWSRHLATDTTLKLLLDVAAEAGVAQRSIDMMSGHPVNTTEKRAVLHTALRADPSRAVTVDGSNIMPAIAAEHQRMAAFVEALQASQRLGATQQPIRTVVNIGIGGSQLGPAMAHEALAGFRSGAVECRFVSNVDPAALTAGLAGLKADSTLFVVVSKGFSTAETLANARAAQAWVTAGLGDTDARLATRQHFVAVTANRDKAQAFGIDPANIFTTWDWIGGRFSMGSAAGLTLMTAIGPKNFKEMLDGMALIDAHVGADPQASVPMLLGLLSVWYRNFWGFQTRAVVPYSHRLRFFGVWLQQVIMESNGKRVRSDGSLLSCESAEIVWGGAGTDSQHSFHQLLHQGTTIVPADFLVMANPDTDVDSNLGSDAGADMAAEALSADVKARHEALVANCFAQAAALAFGTSDNADDPHQQLPGNRSSTVIMAPRLTPSVLGQLVALYEHLVVVQGAIWGINSFDQFGVELGKSLADSIVDDLSDSSDADLSKHDLSKHDPSTANLIAHYRHLSKA